MTIENNFKTGLLFLFGYLVLWAGSLAALHARAGASLSEPLLIFVIVGGIFSLLAWLLTMRQAPLPFSVKNPAGESLALLCYLPLLIAFLAVGLQGLNVRITAEPQLEIAKDLSKQIMFVLLPAALIVGIWKYTLPQLLPGSLKIRRDWLTFLAMSSVLIGFQFVFGRGPSAVRELNASGGKLALGMAISFIWLALDAGVVEEFFFRVLIQSRLAALLKSELAGIVVMAVIFGLAHAPGLYLRPAAMQENLIGPPSLLNAAAYTIVYTSAAGIFLGVLWARTHNFLLVVFVHAATDLVPNLAIFQKFWHPR